MNITTEKLPKSQIKVIVELTPEETNEYLQKATKQVSEMVNVPGFRRGHVPLEVLKKHLKPGVVEAQMIDIALAPTYAKAVKQEDLKVITKPSVNVVQDNPLKYEATVALYPEVTIKGYDKIKIKSQPVKVEDKDVSAVLSDIQQRQATYKKVDRPAQKGDRVEIDFEGFDEGGAPLENTKSKHHPIILGQGSLIPGFEDELTGLKKDETKEFQIKFPKDYSHKPFQNKNVRFKVYVHEVESVELPELTPEFLKQIAGEDKTLDQVKADIHTNLTQERKNAEKTHRENEFLEKIADLAKVDLPPLLVEEEINEMMKEFEQELSSQGINLEKYLEATKKELKDLRSDRQTAAEKRLTLRFALQQIFQQENIGASNEELNKELEATLKYYPPQEQAKAKQEYKEGSFLHRRLENKIKMDKLFASYLNK